MTFAADIETRLAEDGTWIACCDALWIEAHGATEKEASERLIEGIKHIVRKVLDGCSFTPEPDSVPKA